MFTRFATSGEEGLFQVAYRLERSPLLSAHETKLIRRHLDWFERKLPKPSRWVYEEYPEGVPRAWFRDGAREMVARAWELVGVLEERGESLEVRRHAAPGRVVFRDRFQVIVAEHASPEPARDVWRRRRRERETIRGVGARWMI